MVNESCLPKIMSQKSMPQLVEATCVLQFKGAEPKVRFMQQQAEAAFFDLVKVQSHSTNAPDGADPNIPRIIFPAERKRILISQMDCQMGFSFQGQALSMQERFDIVEKNSVIFDSAARSKFDACGYGVSAIIFHVNQPAAGTIEDLSADLYSRLMSVSTEYPVASLQATVGYRVKDCFVTVTVGPFEERQIDVKGLAPGVAHSIKVEDARVVGQGVGLKIDVNNRPAFAEDKNPASISELVSIGRAFFEQHMSDFLGRVES